MITLYKAGKLSLTKRNEYTKKKSGPSIKSNDWEKFHIVTLKETSEVLKNWVQCSNCSKFLPYNRRTTTGLKQHKCPGLKNTTFMDTFLSNEQTHMSKVRFSESDKKLIRDAAEKFIVLDIRPFFALEGEGLRYLLKAAIEIGKRYPTITKEDIDKLIPSRRTMGRHVHMKAYNSKDQIKIDFKKAIDTVGGFSCTTDLCTDRYKSISYLAISAKVNIFENDSIIQKEFIVHMDQVNAPKKTAAVLKTEIEKIFESYDISKEQIRDNITWTTDRGGNIKNALSDSQRLNCFGHLLNNILEVLLNENWLGILNPCTINSFY